MGSIAPPKNKSLPAALSPQLTGREGVQDALHRFAIGMDTNDEELFRSAFTSDAYWDLSGKSVDGLKNILSECYFYNIVKLDTTHYTTNVRINIEENGTAASLHCLYVANHWTIGTGMHPDSKRFTTGGTYYFDAVQDPEDGLWKFKYFQMVKQWSEGDFSVMGHKNPKDVAMLKNEMERTSIKA